MAAWDNASGLHARVGSGLALGFIRSLVIGLGKAVLTPLRVSPLDKLSGNGRLALQRLIFILVQQSMIAPAYKTTEDRHLGISSEPQV